MVEQVLVVSLNVSLDDFDAISAFRHAVAAILRIGISPDVIKNMIDQEAQREQEKRNATP